ncbi:MAG TPA: inositol monophosphatase [Tepidisphaeraceae bacterium]|nr:inositol monophosphatase [Tepidisphaeraceae bacterium]
MSDWKNLIAILLHNSLARSSTVKEADSPFPMSPTHALSTVESIARSAGELILKHYGKVERLTKTHGTTDNEAVTLVDRASQSLIVGKLREAFPGDGIIGEEDELGAGITFDVSNTRGRVWVIDPIDGTNNFIAGLGAFCVSIGLLEAGMPTLGVVFNITRGTMISAARGVGAFIDGKPIRAAETPLSSRSLLMLTGTLYDDDGRLPGWAIKIFSQYNWKPRILGSAALEGALAGAGIAHAAIQTRCKLWDVTAAAAVVIEAGGVVSYLDGRPIFPFDLTDYAGGRVPFLMGGREAHATLLKLIRENP